MAYADPPYPGQSKKHYGDHADYAGEVDHPALVRRLVEGYPDGWTLSTSVSALRDLLPICPVGTRVLAWIKPMAAMKKNVYPMYAWEPVLLCGGRNRFGEIVPCRDWLSAIPPVFRGRRGDTKGAKPEEFCRWLFECMGLLPEDEFDDLFPGSGGVAEAWRRWCAVPPERPFEQAAMAV